MENDNNDLLSQGFLPEEPSYIVTPEDVIAEQSENTDDSSSARHNAPLREQDRFLPIANIVKIMKRAVPDNGKIAKDARECVQECISEFISFITSEASDRCYLEKRKTINGEDVLYAMSTLGFDSYIEPLKVYLHKYRETILAATKGEKTKHCCDDITLPSSDVHLLTDENDQCEAVIYSYPENISFQLA